MKLLIYILKKSINNSIFTKKAKKENYLPLEMLSQQMINLNLQIMRIFFHFHFQKFCRDSKCTFNNHSFLLDFVIHFIFYLHFILNLDLLNLLIFAY